VDEVARIIADGLFTGPVDVYTRAGSLQRQVEYLQGLAGSSS
jgi:hypothetical protein